MIDSNINQILYIVFDRVLMSISRSRSSHGERGLKLLELTTQ